LSLAYKSWPHLTETKESDSTAKFSYPNATVPFLRCFDCVAREGGGALVFRLAVNQRFLFVKM